MLTLELMQRLWPHGNSKVPGLLEGIAAAAPVMFPKYGADENLVIAQAMAQFSHECGAGMEMVENIRYSADRACAVWPSRFHSAGDCYAKVGSFPGDPQFAIKLIDNVYGGRMGNRMGTHDGSRYIGRSLAQTTGHDAYSKLGEILGLDLLSNPDLVCDPKYALEAGLADFVRICNCLAPAQADNVAEVTHRLNGGYIGLAERQAWLRRWKEALATGAQPVSVVVHHPNPTAALALQRALIAEGFDPGAPDGLIGPKTIRAFQRSHNLYPTGEADVTTKALLDAALAAFGKPLATAA
jgi:putative chitinase